MYSKVRKKIEDIFFRYIQFLFYIVFDRHGMSIGSSCFRNGADLAFCIWARYVIVQNYSVSCWPKKYWPEAQWALGRHDPTFSSSATEIRGDLLPI